MASMYTKRCPRCTEIKPLTSFHRNCSELSGLQGYCAACMAMCVARHRRANKEKINAANKVWKDNRREEYRSQPAFKEKRCGRCKTTRDISQFYKNRSSYDGFQGQCKICGRKGQIESRIKNPERYSVEASRRRMGAKEYTLSAMLRTIKYRAKQKGIPFNLEKEDIFLPDGCPALGIELDYGTKKRQKPNSPSLDRRVPNLGYVKGNVQVISVKANVIKNDSTVEELAAVLAYCRVMS